MLPDVAALPQPRPRFRPSLGLALSLLVALDGCGSSTAPVTTVTPVANPLASVVFLGDSLSAGFQNGSLLDTQQPHGFASLLATQAGFSITLPLIAPPGYPNVETLISAGFPPVLGQQSGTTTGRDNPSAQPTDLGVPGFTLDQLIYQSPTTSNDLMTQLVLGYPTGNSNSEAEEAVALNPSTIFLWIGSNDALSADDTGDPTTMTPVSSFTSDFTTLMTGLKSKTSAHLVVANIPDVTLIPYMTPASEVLEAVASATGLTQSTVSLQLGIAPGDLVNPTGLADTETALAAYTPGGALTALPASDVLTASEITTVQSTIASYNQVIAQQVTAAGGTLVDLHAYYATLAAGVSIGGQTATTAYLGGLFGLDGIHPTNTGYALLANQFIAAINTAFTLSVPTVDVAQVASTDPYFGSNIKPTGSVARMHLLAGRRSFLFTHQHPATPSKE